jgi:hypothetical protein
VAESDLNSIEREIEETRERLASTIDQLLHRASPKTIVKREADQVRGFFVDAQGKPRQDNLIKVGVGVVGVVVFFAVVRKIVRD